MQLSAVRKGMRVRIEELPEGEMRSQFIRIGLMEGVTVSCLEKLPGGTLGLHAFRSTDGERLEVKLPGILPGVGDRSSIMYDEVADEYSLISRPPLRGFKSGEPVKVRMASGRRWRP